MSRNARCLAIFDDFTFELGEQILTLKGKPLILPAKTLPILQYLIENRQLSIPHGELMERFWPWVTVSVDSVHKRISEIRRALGDWKALVRLKYVDNATWSTDSRYIHFNGIEEDGQRWLYRTAVATGHVDRLTGLSGFDYPADVWFGVGADRCALALRAARVEEIFRLNCEFP